MSDARDVTGKGTSVKLTTAGGRVCYIADSETEQVEWFSALEGAVARIVKQARAPLSHPLQGVQCGCIYSASTLLLINVLVKRGEVVRPWRA